MMKNLKTLCAAVLAAGFIYAGHAYAETQKFNVPEYSEKNVTRSVQGEKRHDMIKMEYSLRCIDRNDDGKIDIVEGEIIHYVNENEKRHEKAIYVDDNFDGKVDRLLVDYLRGDSETDADGIYDSEQIIAIDIGMDELAQYAEKVLKEYSLVHS